MRSNRREFLASAAVAGVAAGQASADAPGSSLTVQAPAGAVRGRLVDGVSVFSGIPFARSAAGAGRFRPPQPAQPFVGVFDAVHPANVPPQTQSPMMSAPGSVSEDCLQLNIWAPEARGRYPVFVWIYGGGNVSGACGMPIYDGSAFARDGVVAVAINYRVGALGFLELGGLLGPEHRGSSNNAMRDQILALQWVKRNITAFGGDPDQVTVAGESGGAFNVDCLLAAPSTRGLFRRAIMASGGETVHEAPAADALAKLFVGHLGGKERLYTATVPEVLAAQGATAAEYGFPAPFRQLVGPGLLPQFPLKAIRDGAARNVDLMIGVTRDETRFLLPPQMAGRTWPVVPPQLLPSNLKPEQMASVFSGYAKAYPQLSQAQLTWKATTAAAFGVPTMRIADAQSSTGAKVFRYVLHYSPPGSPFGDMSPHGMDLPLIFEKLDTPLAKVFGFTASDQPMARTVHQAWVSFIRTGAPRADDVGWPTYDTASQQTMMLTPHPHVVTHIDVADRQIWAGIA